MHWYIFFFSCNWTILFVVTKIQIIHDRCVVFFSASCNRSPHPRRPSSTQHSLSFPSTLHLRIPHLSFSVCLIRWAVAAAARGVPACRSGTSATRAPTLSAAAPRTEQPPGSTPRMLPSAASAARAALPQAAGRGYGPQRQAPRTRTPWGAPSPSPWCVMFVVCFADERMLPLVSVDCRVFHERRGVTQPPPCAMDQPHENFCALLCRTTLTIVRVHASWMVSLGPSNPPRPHPTPTPTITTTTTTHPPRRLFFVSLCFGCR